MRPRGVVELDPAQARRPRAHRRRHSTLPRRAYVHQHRQPRHGRVIETGECWAFAIDLRPGDKLASPEGIGSITVAQRKPLLNTAAWVYNLDVEGTHTYFVSPPDAPNQCIWVHNAETTCKKTGSYTNTHADGKRYHGKGDKRRAARSAMAKEADHGKCVKSDRKEAVNDREAFKDEARRIEEDGGVENPDNITKRNSPGKKYREEDGDDNGQ